MIIQKPWGTEEVWATTHHSVGKILTINPRQRLSRKYHKIKTHNIRVLKGVLTVEEGPFCAGGDIHEVILTEGMTYLMPANVIHRLCGGEEGVVLLELSSAGASDSVRLEDDYRRVTDVPSRAPQSDK